MVSICVSTQSHMDMKINFFTAHFWTVADKLSMFVTRQNDLSWSWIQAPFNTEGKIPQFLLNNEFCFFFFFRHSTIWPLLLKRPHTCCTDNFPQCSFLFKIQNMFSNLKTLKSSISSNCVTTWSRCSKLWTLYTVFFPCIFVGNYWQIEHRPYDHIVDQFDGVAVLITKDTHCIKSRKCFNGSFDRCNWRMVEPV